jgi:peptidoglycan/LPS O-acetylase OafA/YrhL
VPRPNADDPDHIPALDGVRGVAIGLVLLFHNFTVPGLWLGVDLFFVLSGFLITRILLRTRGEPGYYRSFYIRRALRIAPAYYLLLLVLLLDPEVRERFFWYSAYLGDLTFLRRNPGSVHHTWSLAVEEQFYLVWPLALRLIPRRALPATILALLLIPVCARLLALEGVFSIDFANNSPIARADGLLAGSLLATAYDAGLRPAAANLRIAKWTGALSAAVIGALAVTGNFSVSTRPNFAMFTLGYAAVTLGSLALVWLAIGSPAGSAAHSLLTRTPGLRGLGRISYGVYLYHVPILVYPLIALSPMSRLAQIALGVPATALAIGVALLSYRYFERPLIRLKDVWAPRPSPAPAPPAEPAAFKTGSPAGDNGVPG